MKKLAKIILNTALFASLGLSSIVVQAGSWDNFKIRYFSLTQYLDNQDRELQDIQAQNLDPQKYSRINLAELLNGGPPKDGIPSIDNPKFDTATTTPFPPNETVIGIEINGETVAYPFGIMNWHEIVNDTVGGMNITVSYCPLCDTIIAFERGNTTYGVSGKLYQSCLVMYDRSNSTLYSQPWAIGILGRNVNSNLNRISAIKTTLKNWLAAHPNSKILSTKTGYKRDYFNYPYGSYYTDKMLIFPVRNQDKINQHPKAIISYVWEADRETPENYFSGSSVQFLHSEIKQLKEKIVEFNGRKIRAKWDSQMQTVIVEEFDGKTIPSSTAFAFVYPAFFTQE
ncbi:MAG: DUF3179 domain-containing protein [Cyanobacteriota bacterium]|nr:DUF3179 domain-containing protein [Cyanobacteriota bacterium]